MKPVVLSFDALPSFLTEPLNAEYEFHHAVDKNDAAALATLGPRTRALVAKGETVLTRQVLEHFTALEIIAVCGVGYDGIDVAAACERGIALTNTPDVLTDDVADTAIALMLALSRGVVAADRHVRAGAWLQAAFPLTRKVSGKRLGIVGLGRIGKAIARRAEAFDMSIAYTSRSAKADVAYAFYLSPAALASAVDFLIVATFGGPSTRGLISRAVLDALGPTGCLINIARGNIARGSVVDEPALVAALREKRIAGAGLDVFVDEPNVPAELFALDNVVLTPHMASATVETRTAMGDLTRANLAAHFAGKPLLTPITT